MRSILTVSLVVLFTAYPGLAGTTPPPGIQEVNTGIAAEDVLHDGDLVVILAREADNGGFDLNGDGDALDRVVLVFHVPTLTLNQYPFAVDGVDVDDGVVSLAVSEAADGGIDHNGDGDTADSVLFVASPGQYPTHATGLATADHRLVGGAVVVVVPEAEQGADLNGDGDSLDEVVHLVDWTTGAVTNTGLAGSLEDGALGRFAIAVSEASQGGTDLDGDGLASHEVLHVLELGAPPINLGLPTDSARVTSGAVAFLVPEGQVTAAGIDLNGDGDKLDLVTHLWTPGGAVVNTGETPYGGIDVYGDLLAYEVAEPTAGGDLNGDGDTLDVVTHVIDLNSGIPHNTGLAAVSRVGNDDALVIVVSELWQGGLDANGDADASDEVPFVYDRSTHVGTSLGLAASASGVWIDDATGRVMWLVPEIAQGQDLSGDQTLSQSVLVEHRLDTGDTRVVSGSGTVLPIAVGDGGVALTWLESLQGNINGDDDSTDQLTRIYDVASGTMFFLEGDAGPPVGGAIVDLRDEAAEEVDLNADGDQLDEVVCLLHSIPGDCGELAVWGDGCPGVAREAPHLAIDGCLSSGQPLFVAVSNAAAGSHAVLLLGYGGANDAELPFGCPLLLAQVLPVPIGPLPIGMDGAVGFMIAAPADLPPITFDVQAFVGGVDPGFSSSNAVRVKLP